MQTDRRAVIWIAAVIFGAGCGSAQDEPTPNVTAPPTAISADRDDQNDDDQGHGGHGKEATTLYVWASDQDKQSPDFLAVIDFDQKSKTYGKVLNTVPVPPPGNFGNEPHH